MGKNMIRLLKFAIRYQGLHVFGRDRSTLDALRRMEGLGFILVDWKSRQFILNTPEASASWMPIPIDE